ncbi:uncharacterized protein K460DRAFT_370146 [Cucurbitaria berberidis CBS 394.84]|uniref:Acid phosphatase-like protein n=1 Tax=Cucurbitaria berberidis CBS 394.84 TaxID=1168544 RepID=A0A9P4L4N9_9PLEO|nr:uncharacterized protein K460DRAFT_370146 [Cucurbitaria berberidis CBS 394.84]KAF1842151.1 hypothetical protein K460DRAFT_370146 [Cucurbitaria berberidis CBS 394.84]
MNGWLVFIIVLLLLLAISYFGWYFYARWNASRNGLPAPSMNPIAAFRNTSAGGASNYPGPAPTGIKGWIDTQMRKFKNRNNRYAAGAYEEPGYAAGQPRGRGAGSRLDPDEAWSSRVGDEAYYEEQELGLQEPAHAASSNPYATTPYGAPKAGLSVEPARGRSRNRDSYDEHLDGRSARNNPFGDENAESLRGVSPRPLNHGEDTSYQGGGTAVMPSAPAHKKAGSINSLDSPLNESRRSAFREDIR